MDVVWSDEARADRNAILEFLLARNPVAAARIAEAMVLAADSLSTFPDRGGRAGCGERGNWWPFGPM